MIRLRLSTSALAALFLVSCAKNPSPLVTIEEKEILEEEVQSISWDTQSWMGDGSSYKIRVDRDGYSELSVHIHGRIEEDDKTALNNLNWEIEEELRNSRVSTTVLTLRNYYHESAGMDIFNGLLSAKILDLEPLPADYCDGAGTVVGIRTSYYYQETTIAHLAFDEASGQYAIFNQCANWFDLEEIYRFISNNVYPLLRE
jgi:hypothetical protein